VLLWSSPLYQIFLVFCAKVSGADEGIQAEELTFPQLQGSPED
jgi:hypothetical protein